MSQFLHRRLSGPCLFQFLREWEGRCLTSQSKSTWDISPCRIRNGYNYQIPAHFPGKLCEGLLNATNCFVNRCDFTVRTAETRYHYPVRVERYSSTTGCCAGLLSRTYICRQSFFLTPSRSSCSDFRDISESFIEVGMLSFSCNSLSCSHREEQITGAGIVKDAVLNSP